MNTRRLWVVVAPNSNDVVYSSFDYNRAKRCYDLLMQDYIDQSGMHSPSFARLMDYKFCRYDLSPHYSFDDCVQKEINSDISRFLDFILLKSGKKQNENNTTNTK